MKSPVTLDTIVSYCKRRGFAYPAGEIYGGINGIYDMGPLGALFKDNIRQAWKRSLLNPWGEVVFIEGSLLGSSAIWQASGHLQNFSDPMVDCLGCQHRFRADEIDMSLGCPNCGKHTWTDVRQFNMMFKTQLGAQADAASDAYLRPETAQSVYINFKNVMSTTRLKLPCGIAQVGKSFRNEITPRQFLFRMREFEQMEMQWFVHPDHAREAFAEWTAKRRQFYMDIGLTPSRIRLRPHGKDELAHYSTSCDDVEYEFPFGWKELEGIAHRGNYDLTQHSKHSGKDLSVFDEETKESYTPHVVECAVGTDRLFLTLLFDAYDEDEVDGETRVVLRLHPKLAPIKAAFLPLTKKQLEPMTKLYEAARDEGYAVQLDVSGSIGKRYRRQDEIGTPLCFTYDFDSETDGCVTVRNRDTTQQERIPVDRILGYLKDTLNK